jgi:hypothetical protein
MPGRNVTLSERSMTSVEELCNKLRGLMPDGESVCIGIDGTDGVGKTCLGRKLAPLLGAKLISLDEHLDKKRGVYVPHIRCVEVRAAIEASASPILLEGTCLRGVADRCGITVHLHVYVRRLSANSLLWHEEDICLGEIPVDELKQKERELRMWSAKLSGRKDVERTAEETGLREELIDYHARWKPVQNADVVFDVVA